MGAFGWLTAVGFAGFAVFDAAFADDAADVKRLGGAEGFIDEVDDHGGEFGGVADGGGADDGHAEFLSFF